MDGVSRAHEAHHFLDEICRVGEVRTPWGRATVNSSPSTVTEHR